MDTKEKLLLLGNSYSIKTCMGRLYIDYKMRVNVSFACLHFNDALRFYQVKSFHHWKLLAQNFCSDVHLCFSVSVSLHLSDAIFYLSFIFPTSLLCVADIKFQFAFVTLWVQANGGWGAQIFTHSHIHRQSTDSNCFHPWQMVIPIFPEFTFSFWHSLIK